MDIIRKKMVATSVAQVQCHAHGLRSQKAKDEEEERLRRRARDAGSEVTATED